MNTHESRHVAINCTTPTPGTELYKYTLMTCSALASLHELEDHGMRYHTAAAAHSLPPMLTPAVGPEHTAGL
jgi:hypothetical protein